MRQELKELLHANVGKVIGVIIGVIIGILYLLVGFFKTVIFVLVVVLGYLIGTRIDANENIRDLIERFLPNHWR
jgi:uncharacterized membrane protein